MSDIEILKSPWQDRLDELTSCCAHRLRIMCPFVKADALDPILKGLSPTVKVRLLTRLAIQHFYRRVSDTLALRLVLERRDEVLNVPRLHAKVYLFDDSSAVVTSGNLTLSGLRHNFEYGLLVRDGDIVRQIRADFDALEHDVEQTGRVTKLALDQIERILSVIPSYIQTPSYGAPPSEAEDDVLAGETAAIERALRGWQRVVFNKLNELPQRFTLQEVYKFEEHFRKAYPGNQHVQDAVRRELQVLRDRGLIRFLGGGRYMRLWRD